MPNGVKIELGRGGSVGIFLEDADGVVGEGGNAAVLPEEERPFNCFMENYIQDRHESEAGSSNPSILFKGVGEKLYLWKVLENENPWGIASTQRRNATWDEAAKKVMKPGYVDIVDENGRRTIRVDVCKGTHMSVDAMRKKIKALWQNSKSMFVRGEGETLSQIEEGTMSAVEEGGESEKSQLAKTVRLCESSRAARNLKPLKPTVSKERAEAAAAATRETVLQRLLCAGAAFTAAGGSSGTRGGRSGTRGGRSGTRGGRSGTRGGRSGTRGGRSGTRGGRIGTRGGRSGMRGGRSGTRGGRSGTRGSRTTRGGRGSRGGRSSRGGRGAWSSIQGAGCGGEVAGCIQGAEHGDRVAGRGGRGRTVQEAGSGSIQGAERGDRVAGRGGRGRTVQGSGRGGRGRGRGRGRGESSGKKRSRDSTHHAGGVEVPSVEEEAGTCGEEEEDAQGAGRGVRAGGRGSIGNERGARKRSRGPTDHAHDTGVPSEAKSREDGEEEKEEKDKEEDEEEEEEEEEDQQQEECPSSDDDASVAEGRGKRARALPGSTLSVTQGAGARKRKAPHSSEHGMDAASIAELVDTRVKELMEQDGFGAAAQQQVNERLDQMAAEQRHTLDGIVKQQNMMSSQLAALCSAFSQNAAAAGAAQPPPSSDDTSPPRDTIADMASLPWLGYQSNVVPPCTGMGLGGVAGPYRGATGIAVGVQTGGAYLPGVENAEAALGIEGIASDATQEQQGTAVGVAGTASDGAQEQQGTAAGIVGIENDTGHEDQKEEEPAKGRGDVEGLPAGESPASGFGNEGGAWKLPVSQERRGDCGTAGQVEEAGGGGVEEEEGKGVEMETGLGKGEGGDGPSVSTTTTSALCER